MISKILLAEVYLKIIKNNEIPVDYQQIVHRYSMMLSTNGPVGRWSVDPSRPFNYSKTKFLIFRRTNYLGV